MIARSLKVRQGRRKLNPDGSDSVRGAPSSLVSLVKIANIDTSRGSQPFRSLSILSSTRCWLDGKLTTVGFPARAW